MREMRVRQGEISDLDALRACIEAAFSPYVPRIGQRPAPLDTDFEPLLGDGRVWLELIQHGTPLPEWSRSASDRAVLPPV